MEKISVTYTYNVKFWFTDIHCLTECGKVINSKSGKEVTQFLRGNRKSVYIDCVPVFIEDLKPIKREPECPF